MKILTAFLLVFTTMASGYSQRKIIFTTKFVPHTITYNASPNPNECWEAVADGIEIKTDKGEYFFSMPWQAREVAKSKIGDADVEIEVAYYEEAGEDTGAAGFVKWIKLKGEEIYKAE